MDPVVVGTVGARPLQGREPEMALLASLIDGVGSKGASLVLRGEPGIGKSRLLREAITLAEDRNMTVVSTSGVQPEARLPIRLGQANCCVQWGTARAVPHRPRHS